MVLSPELQKEIEWLDENRNEFPYTEGGLENKFVMPILGGTGFGKSHVVKLIENTRPRARKIREVGTHTTRARKDSDPRHYVTADEGITHESFVDSIYGGRLVNWSYIPETGHLYGSARKSFAAETTLMPALPSSLPQIMKAGFKAVHAVYLIPDFDDWHTTFKHEIENGDQGFFNRLDEARESIQFAMVRTDDIDMIRVVNRHDPKHLGILADRLLKVCDQEIYTVGDRSLTEDFYSNASRLHTYIDKLLRERQGT